MWISGTWSGQLVIGSTGAQEPLLFSLAVLPAASSATPTLIGASLSVGGAVSLLAGARAPLRSFIFTEASTGREFTGELSVAPSPTLRGTWRDGDGGGGFALVLEDESPEHVGGVFVGESAPAPELAEFFFPTNPIFWVVSVARGRVWGAGFFVDAGDVAGSPVLLFTLSGEGAPGALRFEKAYAGLGAEIGRGRTLARERTLGRNVQRTGIGVQIREKCRRHR